MKYITIAIDGPGAAGKSSVAKEVARRLNYTYIDTGAMYRCLTLYALENQIPLKDEKALCEAVDHLDIQLTNHGSVYLNQKDVTAAIRNREVTNSVSLVSSPRCVREKFVLLQQKLAQKQKGVVMDGRDIGTCVLPEADVKIFLTASVETRALRRYKELEEKGVSCDLEEIKKDIKERDERDCTRKIAPLRQAEDAVLIDSSDMTIEEVVKAITDNIV